MVFLFFILYCTLPYAKIYIYIKLKPNVNIFALHYMFKRPVTLRIFCNISIGTSGFYFNGIQSQNAKLNIVVPFKILNVMHYLVAMCLFYMTFIRRTCKYRTYLHMYCTVYENLGGFLKTASTEFTLVLRNVDLIFYQNSVHRIYFIIMKYRVDIFLKPMVDCQMLTRRQFTNLVGS